MQLKSSQNQIVRHHAIRRLQSNLGTCLRLPAKSASTDRDLLIELVPGGGCRAWRTSARLAIIPSRSGPSVSSGPQDCSRVSA